MLLYDNRISGNCYKVRLLFAHLGLEFERREVDVIDRSNRPEVLGGLNPALRVPTLVLDDGSVLAESNAILFYFAEGKSASATRLPTSPSTPTPTLPMRAALNSSHIPRSDPGLRESRSNLVTCRSPTKCREVPALGAGRLSCGGSPAVQFAFLTVELRADPLVGISAYDESQWRVLGGYDVTDGCGNGVGISLLVTV